MNTTALLNVTEELAMLSMLFEVSSQAVKLSG
jgi:hypothetical protein